MDNTEYEIPLAEVELPREGIDVPLPPWVGAEVTGQPDYKKINLQKARLAERAAAQAARGLVEQEQESKNELHGRSATRPAQDHG